MEGKLHKKSTKKPHNNEIWFGSHNRKKCTSSWNTVMRALWKRYQNWAFRSMSLGSTQSKSRLQSMYYMNMVLFIETLKVMLPVKGNVVVSVLQMGRGAMGDIFTDLVLVIYTTIKCIKPSTHFSIYKLLASHVLLFK